MESKPLLIDAENISPLRREIITSDNEMQCIPLKEYDKGCMDPETGKRAKPIITPQPIPMERPQAIKAQIDEFTKIENMDPVLKQNITKEFYRLVKKNRNMKIHRAMRIAGAKYGVIVKFD